MNVLASECSGGCESGWTMYFEQSFLSPNARGTKFVEADESGFYERGKHGKEEDEEEEEVEEDLSMVSDASSGPPHFHEDQGYFNYDSGCFYPAFKDPASTNNRGEKRQKRKERRIHQDHELSSFLDDTASSPAFNFTKNNFALTDHQASMESVLDYSQGFSATHFEPSFLQGGSAYQQHFGYIQPSLAGNQLQNNEWL